MQNSTAALPRTAITIKRPPLDEKTYRTVVLRSSPELTEDELDHVLKLEAHVLGLQFPPQPVNSLPSSISASTMTSESHKPRSTISQSTVPTSCSSSERRHTYQPSHTNSPPRFASRSVTPSLFSYTEKRVSAFRDGFRKIEMFRKRMSGIPSVAMAPRSTEQAVVEDAASVGQESTKGTLENPASANTSKSSWSTSPTPLPSVHASNGEEEEEDQDAIRRTRDCVEFQVMQAQQRDEKARFFEYQRKCLADLRSEHEEQKKQKMEAQAALLREAKFNVCTVLQLP